MNEPGFAVEHNARVSHSDTRIRLVPVTMLKYDNVTQFELFAMMFIQRRD